MDKGKIGISDAFLMHFGFFRNFRSRKTDISDAFLMHFGFLFTGLKKIKHLLTGGVVGIFQKFGDIGSDIAQWCTY